MSCYFNAVLSYVVNTCLFCVHLWNTWFLRGMYFLTFCCFCDHHYMCTLYNLQCSYLCCLFRIKFPEIKIISLKYEVLGWYKKTSHFKPNYFNYRQDGREAAIAGIKIYSQAKKNQHFRPAGATRSTDSRQIWHSRGAPGSTWPCSISSPVPGVGTRPLNVENFNFLVKSRPTSANSWTDFYYC